jgi:hypothetical protein
VVRTPVVSERDLAAVRVGGPECPPEFQGNPVVTRVVRFFFQYTGAAFSQAITPLALTQQDGLFYLSSPTQRYTQIRFLKGEVWFGIDTVGGALPILNVLDAFSNVEFADTPEVGVDYAHIAYRPPLSARSTYQSASSTNAVATVTVPASEGASGHIIIDVTVALC